MRSGCLGAIRGLAVLAALAVPAACGSPGTTASSTPGAPVPAPSSHDVPATWTVAPASAAPTASPPDPRAEPAILVGAGDIASCGSSGDEATAELLDGIAGTVFTAGDNVYDNGSSSEFADCYAPTWGRHLGRTLPVPGNHDYNTAGAAGYFGYFGDAAGDPARGWYATDVGTWRLYALNSNCWAIGGCDAGSAQERWLRADLEANPRACVIAIWHHPLFSSGDHGGNPVTAALWQALEDAGAEIAVTGHDHDYERFAAQNASGAPSAAGIVEFVAGTGGRSHYPFRSPIANSLARDNTAHGVVRFELGADGWSSAFVPVDGESFVDAARGACH